MLKWKPSTHNSVDFKLKLQTQQGVGMVPKLQGLLYVGQRDQPFAEIKVTEPSSIVVNGGKFIFPCERLIPRLHITVLTTWNENLLS